MAPISPSQNLALRAATTSSEPQAHTKASTSKQVVDLLGTLNEGTASIDVTYKIVWTAAEPPSSSPLRRLESSIGWMVAGSPPNWPPRPSGGVRITGSAAKGNIRNKFVTQHDAQSVPTPQPIPEGKIPCIAMLHRGTLGALSTCLYDKATDSFRDFSTDDGTWAHQKDYGDHGEIQISTRKWSQGSWGSVEDDNGNDFLFLTVERGHGLVRVWRPNLVAKRVSGVGEAELTAGEIMRLGLTEDDKF